MTRQRKTETTTMHWLRFKNSGFVAGAALGCALGVTIFVVYELEHGSQFAEEIEKGLILTGLTSIYGLAAHLVWKFFSKRRR